MWLDYPIKNPSIPNNVKNIHEKHPRTLSQAESSIHSESHVTLCHADSSVICIVTPLTQPEIGRHGTCMVRDVEHDNAQADYWSDCLYVRQKYLRLHL